MLLGVDELPGADPLEAREADAHQLVVRHALVEVVEPRAAGRFEDGPRLEKPELARLDRHGRFAIRYNRVKVLEYLKGKGPKEITVITVGGPFEVETPAGTETQYMYGSGLPQLPQEGTDVLLCLRRDPEGYAIASSTHGVRPVQEGEGDQQPWVR